jgi:hypothetical protein
MNMEKNRDLINVLQTVSLLSTIEKLKLIQELTAQIESDLKVTPLKPRKSLRGLWRGVNLSETEITEARKEMWGNFPKELQ